VLAVVISRLARHVNVWGSLAGLQSGPGWGLAGGVQSDLGMGFGGCVLGPTELF
jgi:hypothetical protein